MNNHLDMYPKPKRISSVSERPECHESQWGLWRSFWLRAANKNGITVLKLSFGYAVSFTLYSLFSGSSPLLSGFSSCSVSGRGLFSSV